jgi:hypothetical protein
MQEQEMWDEIGKIEASMQEMHASLDRIIAGSSAPDAKAIRFTANMWKIRIEQSFAGKFHLVEAIQDYFR